jgi:hypothetical protein
MKWRIGRLTLITCCATALPALFAAPALAATATTGSAINVTQTTATLTGTVATGGVATVWQFEYGTTVAYGSKAPSTAQPLAGSATPNSVHADVAGLRPNTVYHFRLDAATGTPNNPYFPFSVSSGKDMTFKTSAGTIALKSTKLTVKNRKVSVTLKCQSVAPCKGKLSISALTVFNNKITTVGCASKGFTIGAGSSSTLTPGVSGRCLRLLRSAPNHRLKGKLKATTTTGQPTLNRNVTLILK